ncbi:hypothetical protein BKA67DRAFT_544101 [Truncatella angustata]|uniref:Uncharacterized protein n=1 Tax=Truncatella angustata TaxID=152316 RepID=A0A9P9A1A9_9PEZI|nr:uncharacterized protein BKA67DRAFT_544101 [Truncatella angustata]KAH6659311.1 hypothetical protein BKA67DRAFT_544101 [Truncatella angustata]
MASAFREDRSHFEPDTPRTSVHGGRGDTGPATTDATAITGGSDDVSSIDHVQEKTPAVVPLTKKQKLKRHCGRFKWWYLAAAIILLAILLPILFLVILPAIVQRIVNNQSLPVNGGAFLALSPTEMMVSLDTSLDTPLPASLDPTTLFLYNHETIDFSPFLNVTLPAVHINGNTDVTVVNQTVTITNQTELEYWFNNIFDDATTDLSVRGDSTVRLGALHSNAHIDKTLEVSSLNQLNGFGIQDLSLIVPALEDGTNVQGTLNLPNWGALTLGLGNVSFNLFSGDVRIGLITIYEVVIPPGNNTRDFSGELFLHDLMQNFGKVLDAQTEALNNGQVQIDAVGNATIVNGQHIPFIEHILNNKRVKSYVSVIKLASDLINSLTGGGNATIVDVLGEVVGNNTLIEQALSHWNSTGTAATPKMKRLGSVGFNAPRALSLLKLGMKMTGRF